MPFGDTWDEIFIGGQSDVEFLTSGRGYHGSGTCDPYSTGNKATDDYAVHAQQSYNWYGLGSVDKAVQIVHIPKNTPTVSPTTGSELRIIVSHNSNTANEGKYRIYLLDVPFYATAGDQRHVELGAFNWTTHASITDVQTNGIMELVLPQSYGTGSIVVSFNKEYCDSLLKHRAHTVRRQTEEQPCGLCIQYGSGAGYVGATRFNANSTKDNASPFPLGLTEWDDH